MTLAELLEKSREYPQNVDVRAVIVDDKWNGCKPELEPVGVFGGRDGTEKIYRLFKKVLFADSQKKKNVARSGGVFYFLIGARFGWNARV